MTKRLMTTVAAFAALGCAQAAEKLESSTFVATHPTRFLPLPTDRAKTLAVFEENVYGRRPSLDGLRKSAKVVATREVPEFNAVRQDVVLNTLTPCGETNFLAVCYVPKSDKPVPAFVKVCLRPVTEYAMDPTSMELYRKMEHPRVPLGDVLGRGFAVMMFHHGSVLPDNVSSLEGVERPADGWGAISTWALAASRCLDWLETEKAVDASRVAVIGHSRGGKTAIWTGVTDTRFALVISNDSGCSGARMNAVISEPCEKIADITRVFPYWFAPNYRARWAGKERELPFDNHQLLALVAPRLLAVGSAIDDYWACPQGEETAVRFASRAWADPLAVHYHCRDGMHTLTPEDWTQYMDFAAAHGWGSR